MNEHLAERFGRSRRPVKAPGNSVDVLVLPQVLNHLGREYYNPPKTGVQGEALLNRPEIPPSVEVLDQDGLDTTGPPANKKEEAWDSKDEYLGTHYELLREHAVRFLREAVSMV